jgi:hypothetical protein
MPVPLRARFLSVLLLGVDLLVELQVVLSGTRRLDTWPCSFARIQRRLVHLSPRQFRLESSRESAIWLSQPWILPLRYVERIVNVGP